MACCYKIIVFSVVLTALGIWLFIHKNKTTGMENYEDDYIELGSNTSSIQEKILVK